MLRASLGIPLRRTIFASQIDESRERYQVSFLYQNSLGFYKCHSFSFKSLFFFNAKRCPQGCADHFQQLTAEYGSILCQILSSLLENATVHVVQAMLYTIGFCEAIPASTGHSLVTRHQQGDFLVLSELTIR